MAGLNPDGLGRNRSFDDTESESVNTDELNSVQWWDGSDLQTFLNDVGSNSIARLPPGTFDISGSPIDPPDNITIVGSSQGTTLRSTDGTTIFESDTPTRVWIRGIMFDGYFRNHGSEGAAINFTNSRRCEISGCRFYDFDAPASTGAGVVRLTGEGTSQPEYAAVDVIRNNRWFKNPNLSFGIVLGEGREYTVVENNVMAPVQAGMDILDGNCRVQNNIIEGDYDGSDPANANAGVLGIRVDGVGSNDGKTQITDNQINHFYDGDGILLRDVKLCKVADNIMLSGGGSAIIVENTETSSITDNQIGNWGQSNPGTVAAIELTGAATTNNSVNGNFAGSYGSDMSFGIVETSSATGNQIRSNATLVSGGFSLNSTAAVGQNDAL